MPNHYDDMQKTNALSAHSDTYEHASGVSADSGNFAGSSAKHNREPLRSSKFEMPAILQRLTGRRLNKQPPVTASLASPLSIAELPAEVVRKIGNHLQGSRDVTHFALATSSLESALAPEQPGDKLAFLKQTAESARDPESFALSLRTARSLPGPMHASILEVHASRLGEIATADGSFVQMIAGAKDAADRFRQLMAEIAKMPASARGGPLAALAPHLKYLPPDERRGTMETMLDAATECASPQQRSKILRDFALGVNQFDYLALPQVALRLLREAETLPADEVGDFVNAFRSGLRCAIPEADRITIEAALARYASSNLDGANTQGRNRTND